jgi:iron complex outermembrane receptor protein
MTFRSPAPLCALLAALAAAGPAWAEEASPPALPGLTVHGRQPSPGQPLSTQTLDADTIAATINATTVEDTLKYLPNILVRRRHIGDTQAPITTRTSGVGSSARSLVYADGVLLSALIGNNNSTASPRWGMVSPEEIERIEVLYGPFSAAYPGNSIGAVVNIVTRSPQAFEVQAKVAAGAQHFSQYGMRGDFGVGEAAASLGDRRGGFAWRLSLNHLESDSQPLNYVTATIPSAFSAAGAPVTGAVDDRNRTGAAIVVLGAGGLEHQAQDNARLMAEWSPGAGFTATYRLGYFGNRTDAHAESYLRDASGAPVFGGVVNIGGRAYTPAASFSSVVYDLDERHWMQALSLRGEATPSLRWEVTATDYDYGRDEQRTPTAPLPGAMSGGAGTILDLSGTGWRTFDAKASLALSPAHTVSFGAHSDRFVLGSNKYNTADWLTGGPGAPAAVSRGKTQTDAVFLEDAIRLATDLRLTLGVRQEHWRAFDGFNFSQAPALAVSQPNLSADRTSPKAVLAWSPAPAWRVTASVGEAYRFPTVSELYQSVSTPNGLAVPNPFLAPERAISTELSAERSWPQGRLRISAFSEDVSDALISQTAPLAAGAPMLASFVQNIDKVRSRGIELAGEARDVVFPGLDLSASATWVTSTIARDPAFPAAQGKRTPQVPRLRWTAVATWRASERLTLTAAARYSDRVYGTIDNSDLVGHTYQGFEGYFVVDARATWRIDRHWSAAVGVDNLNNADYFVFHPFPQGSVLAEVRYAY